MSDIKQRICNLRVTTVSQRPFIPWKDLERTLDEETIVEVLRKGGIEIYQRKEAVGAIINGGRRVFGILCILECEAAIMQFLELDSFLTKTIDSGLPFNEQALRRIVPAEYRSFYDIQWQFCAPMFGANMHHRHLDSQTILPFMKVKEITSGAFGKVSRVVLRGSHQDIEVERTNEVEIVLKELKDPIASSRVEFERERHILSMLKCLKHPNIIPFYTSYTMGHIPCFLFAPADFSLGDLLSRPRPPQFNTDESLFQALHGLASAIAHVHKYFHEEDDLSMVGCHYDLKPSNILVKGNKLILADFGLSRLKLITQGSRSTFKGGTSDYLAPECQDLDGDLSKNSIGRGSDIWSFGCILAEVATYLELGHAGVEEFSQKRKITFGGFLTMRPFHSGAKPSPAVAKWLERLKNTNLPSEIRQGLLVLVQDMLTFDVLDRPDAHRVLARLFILAQRSLINDTYNTLTTLKEKSDYPLRIECIRFEIWCDMVGLGSDAKRRQQSWFLTDEGSLHIDKTIATLQSVATELQASLVVNESVERYNNPVHLRLRELVSDLWNILNDITLRRMESKLEEIILDQNDSDITGYRVTLARPAYREIQLLLSMKQATSSVGTFKNKGRSFLTDAIVRDQLDIGSAVLGLITAKSGKDTPVLVEILEYEDEWTNRFDELVLRVNGLVSVLSQLATSSFPVLRCINFCHLKSQHSFGLIYETPLPPLGLPKASAPVALAEIIRPTQPRPRRPLLSEIFVTAHTLASALLKFHKADWLHKGISSYNIIYFPNSGEELALAFSRPYLIGFNHSRENSDYAFTLGPTTDIKVRDYQHPEYREGGPNLRFREEFDYFSLGIVLLELGLWRTLSSMTKGKERAKSSEIRQYLLDEMVPSLGSYMGKVYRDLVRICIDGCKPSRTGNESEPAWYVFQEMVVEPLFHCLSIHHARNLDEG
ncbi:kinase-like protein [Mollisia scopiformis]|uniref:Kinase-like protein n=1 Tax=Mollisia scopiformis TaxID=149040 RepID=A0A132B6W0_MOLSC|nr:kinase-like protein [Mollisia scopiformis]KUJ08140.1 kinase-like protein [Mollisia scopiformis]